MRTLVPANRHIPWWKKINPIWAFFQNEDDPTPPDSYDPGKPMWWRRVTWWFRNPMHNLTFYVIGIADVDHFVESKFGTDVHPPQGGWMVAWVERGWIRLPFVSYLGKRVKAYIGWRPVGAFGLKFDLLSQDT